MIYPQEDFKKWASMYKIDMTPIICFDCRSSIELNVPIALKDYRGLAGYCECSGVKLEFCRVVPISEDKIKLWEGFRP